MLKSAASDPGPEYHRAAIFALTAVVEGQTGAMSRLFGWATPLSRLVCTAGSHRLHADQLRWPESEQYKIKRPPRHLCGSHTDCSVLQTLRGPGS